MKVFLRNDDIRFFEAYLYLKPEYVAVTLACGMLEYKNIKYKIVSSHISIPEFDPFDNCEPFVDIFVEPIVG